MKKPNKAAVTKVATVASVPVAVKMDPLTRTSTASMRKNMSEAIKKDMQVLKKFGLLTH